MAAHLARRYDLVVWNRTLERARVFADQHGSAWAATPADAAEGAEVVLTCLPTSAEVAALLDGPHGVLATLAAGALFLDCTSGDPASSRRIAAQLAERGVAFADAPVSGGTNGAEAGTLTVMVGGTVADFERGRPVLEAFGRRIVHMGPVGAGHAMKAVNNALLAVNIQAAGEGLATLIRAGVDPRLAVETLNVSSGRSFVSEALVPERVLTGAWPRTFRLALLHKDLGIALDLARAAAIQTPVLGAASAALQHARGELDGDADYLEAIRVVERQAGVEIRG
jgi:3-hydroxyisobutyrate dehydrogenase